MNATTTVQVLFDRGETKARLRIAPCIDPSSVTLVGCLGAIEDRRIRLTDEIRAAVEQVLRDYQANPEPGIDAVISQMTPATPGKRGFVEWQGAFDPDVSHSPLEDVSDDERADFCEMSNREMVTEGEWVATIHPPTPGTDGLCVRGEVIKAAMGAPAPLPWDDSFELDDKGRLVARRSGIIDRQATRLRILRRLEVHSNADFSTGHIDFDGQVLIDKGVKDCFRVTCTGDLSVRQLVEAADIDAGGEVILCGGMSARGKGSLRAGGDLVAHYLSRVTGSITGHVRVEKEVYDCTLSVVRSLWIEFGALIGGETHVGGNVTLGTIGSGGHVPTALIVGRQRELMHSLRRIEKLIMTLAAIEAAKPGPRTSARDQSVGDDGTAAVSDHDQNRPANRLDMLCRRRDEIQEFLETFEPPSIRVLLAVNPNVTITLGEARVTFNSMLKGPMTIAYRKGRPVVFFERTGAEMSLEEAAKIRANKRAA